MNTDAIEKLINAHTDACASRDMESLLAREAEAQLGVIMERIAALEAENEAKDEEIKRTKEAWRNLMRYFIGAEDAFEQLRELDPLVVELWQKCTNALNTPPTGMVLVKREKLEDLRDLARTGTPPASYGLGDDAWAKCRLHGIAGKLAALLKEE